ncbi:MAG: L,D-transpeptidase family protein [Chloroflexota bacterium]
MNRKFVIAGLLLALLMLGASLTTVHVQQASAESRAQNTRDLARSRTIHALHQARLSGLLPAETAGFVRRVHSLTAQREPPSTLLFGGVRASFFDTQTRAYRRVTRAIGLKVVKVTKTSKRLASSHLQALAGEAGAAAPIGVDTAVVRKNLAVWRTDIERASTPKDYRALDALATGAARTLSATVAQRQSELASIVSRGGGSKSGVLSAIDSEVTQAEASLPLLQLFTKRAIHDRALLESLRTQAQGQTTARGAAVKAVNIGSEAAVVRADYRKTVPAKVILVSTEQQQVTLYRNGQVVLTAPVTTGGPELPTDLGVYHIYFKASPFEFHSPWPPGSPYYYSPTPVTYWMPFDGGEGLHDASWRSNFGPGSNVSPTDLGGGRSILGTHGCVNLPYSAAQFIWNWAPVGTAVVVV